MDSILIVAHGSSEDLNGDAAPMFAERLSASIGRRVHHAYKGDREPTLESALKGISEEEPDRIVVLPLFFAPGIFADRFVPKMFGLGPGERKGKMELDGRTVDVVIAEAFGIQPGMRKVMEGIVRSRAPKDGKTAVVLIGHGSKDPANRNTVELNARYVRDLGYETICCYNEFDSPTVEEGLEQALATGSDSILVIPMFTSSSHHSVVEIPGKLGLDVGQSEGVVGHTRLIYATEVGLSPGMDEVLLEEYRSLQRSVQLLPDDAVVERVERDEIGEHRSHRYPRHVPSQGGCADDLRRMGQRESPDDVPHDGRQRADREDGPAEERHRHDDQTGEHVQRYAGFGQQAGRDPQQGEHDAGEQERDDHSGPEYQVGREEQPQNQKDRTADQSPEHPDDRLPEDNGRGVHRTEDQLVEARMEQPLYDDLLSRRRESGGHGRHRHNPRDRVRHIAHPGFRIPGPHPVCESHEIQQRPDHRRDDRLRQMPLEEAKVAVRDPADLAQEVHRIMPPVISRKASSSVVFLTTVLCSPACASAAAMADSLSGKKVSDTSSQSSSVRTMTKKLYDMKQSGKIANVNSNLTAEDVNTLTKLGVTTIISEDSGSTTTDVKKMLSDLGISFLELNVKNLVMTEKSTSTLGILSGNEDKAEKYNNWTADVMNTIKKNEGDKWGTATVMCITMSNSVSGTESDYYEATQEVGGKNLADWTDKTKKFNKGDTWLLDSKYNADYMFHFKSMSYPETPAQKDIDNYLSYFSNTYTYKDAHGYYLINGVLPLPVRNAIMAETMYGDCFDEGWAQSILQTFVTDFLGIDYDTSKDQYIWHP